ncbi:MAG TPA: glycosyltransferase [Chloroflexota bacterium]
MRVGSVTDFYYPWIGGPATMIRNLGHGLGARGHSVSLLAPSPDGRREPESDGNITVQRAPSVPIPVGYQLRVSSSPLLATSRWLDHVEPDIVHVHHPFPLSAAAVWAARRRGIPIVATNHTIPDCALWGIRDFGPAYKVISSGFARWIVRVLARCSAVATPTETAAELLRQLGYHGHIVPISNGVDTARFQPGPPSSSLAQRLQLSDRPVVLYTGRLDAEKQLDVWLRGAAMLAAELDIQFLIGGQGAERPRLEAIASALGISDRIIFFGYLAEEEYPQIYRLADVFCITSPVELQSISTLEAMASGLPIVAVRAGALPELVSEGENGLLVEPGNASALARALASVLQDTSALSSMGSHSRTIALQHDLCETVERYERLFFQAAGVDEGARA